MKKLKESKDELVKNVPELIEGLMNDGMGKIGNIIRYGILTKLKIIPILGTFISDIENSAKSSVHQKRIEKLISGIEGKLLNQEHSLKVKIDDLSDTQIEILSELYFDLCQETKLIIDDEVRSCFEGLFINTIWNMENWTEAHAAKKLLSKMSSLHLDVLIFASNVRVTGIKKNEAREQHQYIAFKKGLNLPMAPGDTIPVVLERFNVHFSALRIVASELKSFGLLESPPINHDGNDLDLLYISDAGKWFLKWITFEAENEII